MGKGDEIKGMRETGRRAQALGLRHKIFIGSSLPTSEAGMQKVIAIEIQNHLPAKLLASHPLGYLDELDFTSLKTGKPHFITYYPPETDMEQIAAELKRQRVRIKSVFKARHPIPSFTIGERSDGWALVLEAENVQISGLRSKLEKILEGLTFFKNKVIIEEEPL